MNTLQKFEARTLKKLTEGKVYPKFAAGDTLKVNIKIREGAGADARERIQAYEGVCIGIAGSGVNTNFTVRKISYGEGVERVFPMFSPVIDSIEVVRRGSVRRAKLYYLRGLRGKSARIVERNSGHGFDDQGNEIIDEAVQAALDAKKAIKKEKKVKPKAAVVTNPKAARK